MKIDIRGPGGPASVPNGGTGAATDVFHVEFDPETDTPSRILVEAVAVIHGIDQTELDPLGDTIDPDALETVLDGSASGTGAERVRFHYDEFDVTIEREGHIWLSRESDTNP